MILLLFLVASKQRPKWMKTCPRCKIPSEKNPKSSERDVVMMMIAKKMGRVELTVRSLRSTGCRAQILIFVDSNLQPPEDFVKLNERCGVRVVYVNLTQHERQAPHLTRFLVYKEWLDDHYKEYDRVMHIDAFDAFFQHDPFSDGISHDALDIVLEDKKIRSCPWNTKWLRDCYGPKIKNELRDDVIACSGSIGGSAKIFKRFLEALIKLPKFKECWNPSIDQAHLNYLLYSGRLAKAKIPTILHGCNSSFLTMTWCSKESRVIDHAGLLLNPAGEEPAFVHQYNRYEEMISYYESICPAHK